MRLLLGGVILCLFGPSYGGWLKDLLTPKGWQIGDGFVLHLTNSRYHNSTFLERYSILMDYSGYGFGVTKIPNRKALEVDLYAPRTEEARASKSRVFSIIIGYKLATIAAVAISAVGALALKALIVAKIAAVTSAILMLGKVFHEGKEKHHAPQYFEVDQLPPDLHGGFSEAHPVVEYYPTGSGNYYSYANSPVGIDYSTPEIPGGGNATVPVTPGNQQVARRRDGHRRRKMPIVTIHQYSLKT